MTGPRKLLEKLADGQHFTMTDVRNLQEELEDEQHFVQDYEDTRPRWRRNLSKTWEATKAIASFAMVVAFTWGIYEEYPASRYVIETVAPIVVVFFVFGALSAIPRALRRRRRRMEFARRELEMFKTILNEKGIES
jgi:membrane protein YdbS with pleckstrin-like domain